MMAMPGTALKGTATRATEPGTPFTPYSQPHVSFQSLLPRLSLGWFLHCIVNLTEMVNAAAVSKLELFKRQSHMLGTVSRQSMETMLRTKAGSDGQGL